MPDTKPWPKRSICICLPQASRGVGKFALICGKRPCRKASGGRQTGSMGLLGGSQFFRDDQKRKTPQEQRSCGVLECCEAVRNDLLVPRAGLEPARLAAGDFESPASTCFTTWACLTMCAGRTRSETRIMSEIGRPGKVPPPRTAQRTPAGPRTRPARGTPPAASSDISFVGLKHRSERWIGYHRALASSERNLMKVLAP